MKQTKQKNKERNHQFNPWIVVGIIGKSDLNSLQELKDFFEMLDGFSLVYFTTSGNPLYVTSEKPQKWQEGGN